MADGTNLTPLHCATYALNPKWYDVQMANKRTPYEDGDVMKVFWAAIKKTYGRGEDASLLRSQWNNFSGGHGDFSFMEALYDMKKKKTL